MSTVGYPCPEHKKPDASLTSAGANTELLTPSSTVSPSTLTVRSDQRRSDRMSSEGTRVIIRKLGEPTGRIMMMPPTTGHAHTRFAALTAGATARLEAHEALIHIFTRNGDELMMDDLDLVQTDDVLYFGPAECEWRPPPSESAENAVRLCTAAFMGNLDELRSLVMEEGCSVGAGDYDKRTAMHLAACEGRLEMVRMMVEDFNADLSPIDRESACAGTQSVAALDE